MKINIIIKMIKNVLGIDTVKSNFLDLCLWFLGYLNPNPNDNSSRIKITLKVH